MYRKLIGACVGLAMMGMAGTANAVLMGSAGGLIDTDTGLEWLDVVVNANISFDQLIATDLTGFGSFGYRYATVFEVGVLFENAGAILPPLGTATFDAANQPAGDLLISFLGANSTNPVNTFIQAFTSTPGSEAGTVMAPWIRGSGIDGIAGLDYGRHQPSTSASSPTTGSWVVRSSAPIPEPSTLALFATGLALLAFLSWRRRRAVQVGAV